MILETKFDVGEIVWVILNTFPKEAKILKVVKDWRFKEPYYIVDIFGEKYARKSFNDTTFASKDEINSLSLSDRKELTLY